MRIRLPWPNKILLYSIALTGVAVLLTAGITVKTATHLWEREFVERNTAYARYTSLEVLRAFGGTFSGILEPEVSSAIEVLTGYNEDLVGVMILTESGRSLFSTLAEGVEPGLEASWEAGLATAVRQVIATSDPLSRISETGGSRYLDVLAPVSSQGGSRPIAVRYVYGYGSLEEKISGLVFRVLMGALGLLALGTALSAALSRAFTRPVRILSTGASRIAAGDREHVIRVDTGDEMEHLADQFNHMVRSLREQQGHLESANRELTEANDQLRELQAQLVRSERLAALGQLSAGVSHELDNPIGVILGYAELTEEEAGDSDQVREYSRVILAEAKRCKRIIAGLLDFSRPSHGEKEVVDLMVLIDGLIGQLREQRAFKGIEWKLERCRFEPIVLVDPEGVRQVLVNLALNAAQSMAEAGTIEISLRRMEHGGREGFGILVVDSGPGIEEALLEKVFDPFFTTKGRGEGTGLGLSICRKLMEEAGGWIRAVSGPGGRFEMWLPEHPAKGHGEERVTGDGDLTGRGHTEKSSGRSTG